MAMKAATQRRNSVAVAAWRASTGGHSKRTGARRAAGSAARCAFLRATTGGPYQRVPAVRC
eukprot:1938623-Alexandrium_andersonii.AAC.1